MRCFLMAALALAASAELAQVHRPAKIPTGWEATSTDVPSEHKFKVNIGMKRSNTDRLSKLVDEVSNPMGENYLQYPSYAALGDLVRPSQDSMKKVLSWLSAHGAVVESVHPHGDYIHAVATVAQIEAMANGKFQAYSHSKQGEIFRLTTGVQVDAEIASVIDTFSGFHGFPLPYVAPIKTRAGASGVTPALFRSTYNITAVAPSGKKNIQAIAQFQGQYITEASLDKFCSEFDNGASCKITKFIGTNLPISGVESMLDSEYIMSIGNRTETWAYSYPNVDFCSDLTTFGSNVTGESEFPYVISISYGSQYIDFCEQSIITRFSEDIQKMGTMGITVMISSGDDGSGGETRQGSNGGKLSPSFPASIPYCTAVGGTYFVSGTSGEQEATTQFGSGGGFSYDYSVPSFQSSAVSQYLSTVTLPKAEYAKNGRGSPDVSTLAEDFNIISSGITEQVAGTSCSSPSFAGMMTLLNEVCLAASGKSLGFVNPFFYQNPGMFTDITKGTNAIGENTKGWEAIKGWDASTGLGVPDFSAMVAKVKTACASARRN